MKFIPQIFIHLDHHRRNQSPIMTLMSIILKTENHRSRKVSERSMIASNQTIKLEKKIPDEELDYVEGGYGGHHNSPTSTSHVKGGSENDDSTDSIRHNNNNFIHNNKNRESNYYDNNKYSEMHKQKHRFEVIIFSKS